MRVLDPGHLYELAHLDDNEGAPGTLLRFVKRCGSSYPGNSSHYAGTNTQEVLRALIDRMKYVREQALEMNDESSAIADAKIIRLLREAMWLLEECAARRHAREWPCVRVTDPQIEDMPTCFACGHVGCEGRQCGR